MSAMGSWDKDNMDSGGTYRKVELVLTRETYQPPKAQRPLVFINNNQAVTHEAAKPSPVVLPPFPIHSGVATRFWNLKIRGEHQSFAEYDLFLEMDWKLGLDWLHLKVPVYVGLIKTEGEWTASWVARTHPWIQYHYDSVDTQDWYFDVGLGADFNVIGNRNGPQHNAIGGGVWLGGGHKYFALLVGMAGGTDYHRVGKDLDQDTYFTFDVRAQLRFDQLKLW